MHDLEYHLTTRDAGFRAPCTCGEWTYDGVVDDPWDPSERQAAHTAWLMHAGYDESVEE